MIDVTTARGGGKFRTLFLLSWYFVVSASQRLVQGSTDELCALADKTYIRARTEVKKTNIVNIFN